MVFSRRIVRNFSVFCCLIVRRGGFGNLSNFGDFGNFRRLFTFKSNSLKRKIKHIAEIVLYSLNGNSKVFLDLYEESDSGKCKFLFLIVSKVKMFEMQYQTQQLMLHKMYIKII